jgi:PAS domain S-box-containing protein
MALLAPIGSGDRALGLVHFELARPHRYGPADQAGAAALAAVIALALDRARLAAAARAAEGARQRLLDGLADAALVVVGGRVAAANPAAAGLLGHTINEVVGQPFTDLLADAPPGEPPLAPPAGGWHGELTLRRADGGRVPVEATVTPLAPTEGADREVIVVAHDISERRVLTELQEQFLATVSHEWRTPLTAITAHADLLRRQRADVAAATDHILDGAARLNRLLDELLEAGSLGVGPVALRRRPVDLAALVRAAIGEALATPRDRTVDLIVPDAPVVGNWDDMRLRSVVDHLLANALTYTPAGGQVAVRVEAAGAWARLAVTDDGPGLPPAEVARLFGRFHRTERARADQVRGLGLGLYLCRRLVEAHGGRIQATSALGAGMTMVVELPLTPPTPALPGT